MRDSRQHPRARARRVRRAGITLIEIAMVVVIVGVGAAVAVPRLNGSGMRVDASARAVRGALQVAQRTAVMRQFDVIVGVDVSGGGLRVVEDANSNGTADAGERTTWVRLEEGTSFATPPAAVGVAGGNVGAVMLAQPRTVDGLPSIVFRRHGAASSDAEIFVTAARDDEFRAVTVVRATGRAEWYRHDGGWKRVGS